MINTCLYDWHMYLLTLFFFSFFLTRNYFLKIVLLELLQTQSALFGANLSFSGSEEK